MVGDELGPWPLAGPRRFGSSRPAYRSGPCDVTASSRSGARRCFSRCRSFCHAGHHRHDARVSGNLGPAHHICFTNAPMMFESLKKIACWVDLSTTKPGSEGRNLKTRRDWTARRPWSASALFGDHGLHLVKAQLPARNRCNFEPGPQGDDFPAPVSM